MSIIGRHIVHLDCVDSTNNYVAKQLSIGHFDLERVILADFQTAGRGQRGSTWQSEAGQNLTFSFAFSSQFLPVQNQFLASKAVSVACHAFLLSILKSQVYIKWPNDLLVSDAKIGGLLLEQMAVQGNKFMVVGVGINLNQTQFSADFSATSLALELGHQLEVLPVLKLLLDQLNHWVEKLMAGQFAEIHQEYMSRLYGADQWIELETASRRFSGKIITVEDSGLLLARSTQGHAGTYQPKEIKINY